MQESISTNKKIGIIGKVKAWLSSLGIFARAFCLVAVAFFLFGISTLGVLNGTGNFATVMSSSSSEVSFAYQLNYQGNQKLSNIYINVGSVYEPVGTSNTSSTLRVHAYSFSDTSGSWSSVGSYAYISNIFTPNSGTYKSGANYNWLPLTTSNLNSTAKIIRITFNRSSAQFNEVVFLDADDQPIAVSAAPSYCEGIVTGVNSAEGHAITVDDVKATIDAQGSFHKSDAWKYNFTKQEQYILETISGIGQGNVGLKGAEYTISTDYAPFGIDIYGFFTLIFGKSTFGLRLPSFLATFGAFVLLYIFGKQLFKSEKWGFVLSVVFGIGGMFFTVGRLGTPMALVLLLVLASIYFMYQFFAKGVDGENVVRSALPVLFSGLSAAGAIATYSVAIFPCLIPVVIFVFGVLRLFAARDYQIAKIEKAKVAEGGEVAEETEEARDYDREIRHERVMTSYKMRVSVGYALIGFIAATLLFMIVGMIPTFYAYSRVYDSNNMLLFIWQSFVNGFAVSDSVTLSDPNVTAPWMWLLGLKGATLYSFVGDDVVAMFNAQANPVLCVIAMIGAIYTTVYFILGTVALKSGKFEQIADIKAFKQARRTYVALMMGALLTFVPYCFISGATAMEGYMFYFFYLAFGVLMFYVTETQAKAKGKSVIAQNVLLCVVGVMALAIFAVSLPMYCGWLIGEGATGVYNWTALISNESYGLIKI